MRRRSLEGSSSRAGYVSSFKEERCISLWSLDLHVRVTRVSTASSIPPWHNQIRERKAPRAASGSLSRENTVSHQPCIRLSLTFLWQKLGLTPTPKQITGQEHEITGVSQDQLWFMPLKMSIILPFTWIKSGKGREKGATCSISLIY